jgi:hypothetical protein
MENTIQLPDPYVSEETSEKDFVKVQTRIYKMAKKSLSTQILEWVGYHTVTNIFYLYLFTKYKSRCIIKTNHSLGFNIYISPFENDQTQKYHRNMDYSHISKQLVQCIKNGTELTIIPLSLRMINGGHANLLIYRKNGNIIEHFEPQGAEFSDNTLAVHINNELNNFIKVLNDILTSNGLVPVRLVPSSVVCPLEDGLQNLESDVENTILDTGNFESEGYCAVWSLFFTELALENPTIESSDLVKHILITSKSDPNYLKHVVRGYVIYISERIETYFSILFRENENEKINLNAIITKTKTTLSRETINLIISLIIDVHNNILNDPNYDINTELYYLKNRYDYKHMLSIPILRETRYKILILENIISTNRRIQDDTLSPDSVPFTPSKLSPNLPDLLLTPNASPNASPNSKPLIKILEESDKPGSSLLSSSPRSSLSFSPQSSLSFSPGSSSSFSSPRSSLLLSSPRSSLLSSPESSLLLSSPGSSLSQFGPPPPPPPPGSVSPASLSPASLSSSQLRPPPPPSSSPPSSSLSSSLLSSLSSSSRSINSNPLSRKQANNIKKRSRKKSSESTSKTRRKSHHIKKKRIV